MKKFIQILAALLLAATGVLSVTAPAHADIVGCVTQAEFNDVNLDMRMQRVHDIIGSEGDFVDQWQGWGSYRYQQRVYKRCSDGSLFTMTYYKFGSNDDTWQLYSMPSSY